jgi:hypothetical protein
MERTTKKQRQREGTAYHEAGHAVAALELGFRLKRVSINEGDDHFGTCEGHEPPSWLQSDGSVNARTRSWIERRIMGLLAGSVAEKRFTGRSNPDGARQDRRCAVNLAEYVCGNDEEIEAYLAWLKIRTANLLARPERWAMVEAVAQALLEREAISGRQAKATAQAARLAYLQKITGAEWLASVLMTDGAQP